MGKGFAVAGNIITDHVKIVDKYPDKNNLCNILDMEKSVGGLVCNVGVNLALMDKSVPVTALGCVGDDADGGFALKIMKEKGVQTDKIKILSGKTTSFTDVMSVKDSGERTFFHWRGANAYFTLSESDFEQIDCNIFHMGYALLLDSLDAPDPEYGTVMAKILSYAQKKGCRTSLDAVSESGVRFKKIITPSLRYCNFAVMNETESGMVSGISPRDEKGVLIVENIEKICRDFFEKGVSDYVIIHCPEAGFLMDSKLRFYAVPSFELPEGYIKGTVGAGDAFCAGALYSVYRNFMPEQILKTASASAAANLSSRDSIGGARSFEEILKLEKMFKRRSL